MEETGTEHGHSPRRVIRRVKPGGFLQSESVVLSYSWSVVAIYNDWGVCSSYRI